MKTRRVLVVVLAALALPLSVALPIGAAIAQPSAPVVLQLDATGVVDPFLSSYIDSGIQAAEAESYSAVLLRIDTPGGLVSSMREIVQAIAAARVPVVCWVGPEGARAASAGAFLLIGCPVAAMAPGTNVGAAHPVGVSGAIESQKAENDAAAYIRSLAETHDRNPDWAERAVRDSESATAEEALQLGVIDLIAADPSALLGDVHGRTVDVGAGETVRLETRGATIQQRAMGTGASILHALLSPDLAFFFFFVGLLLLTVEVITPGLGLPGLLGGLMLLGAFVAFGVLPVTLVGLTLLVVSAVAFFVDIQNPGTGAATAIGLVTLVLGGLFLFDSSVPNARVSYPVIGAVAVLLALFFGVTVNKVLEARRRPADSGLEALVGAAGMTESRLAPTGMVRARGESWTAYAPGGPIPKGTPVVVRRVDGLRLEVEPAETAAPADAAATMEKGSEG